MSVSELKFIKRCAEHIDKKDFKDLMKGLRGIYALFIKRPKLNSFDLVYIGMARTNMKGRIRKHFNSMKKSKYWSHFSIFEVWDNISDAEIEELEGLFRHLYKKDSRANQLNKQKGYQKINKVRDDRIKDW